MSQFVNEMEETLKCWENDLNRLIIMRDILLSSNSNQSELIETNTIIKEREYVLKEVRRIINELKKPNDNDDNEILYPPPTYEESINKN
jgi:hypothetical protein